MHCYILYSNIFQLFQVEPCNTEVWLIKTMLVRQYKTSDEITVGWALDKAIGCQMLLLHYQVATSSYLRYNGSAIV